MLSSTFFCWELHLRHLHSYMAKFLWGGSPTLSPLSKLCILVLITCWGGGGNTNNVLTPRSSNRGSDPLYIFSWEPEGHYHYSMRICWKREEHCVKSMVIAPFWFSAEHHWTALTPFWLSANDMHKAVLYLCLKYGTNPCILQMYVRNVFPQSSNFLEFSNLLAVHATHSSTLFGILWYEKLIMLLFITLFCWYVNQFIPWNRFLTCCSWTHQSQVWAFSWNKRGKSVSQTDANKFEQAKYTYRHTPLQSLWFFHVFLYCVWGTLCSSFSRRGMATNAEKANEKKGRENPRCLPSFIPMLWVKILPFESQCICHRHCIAGFCWNCTDQGQ